jgi:hypothetical protein
MRNRDDPTSLAAPRSGANRMAMFDKRRSRRAAYWRAYDAIAAGAAAGTVVPVVSRRLHQTSFAIGHVAEVPAVFTVLVAAASAVQFGRDATGYAIAGAELVAGAGVLIAIALEARHLFGDQPEHGDTELQKTSRVDASSLAAAALGFLEAWHRTHVEGHFKLVGPQVVGATLSLFVAYIKSRPPSAHRQRRQRRQLHVCITPAGITYLAGPRRNWRAEWAEVAAVEHDHGQLALRLHDGRRHVLRADDHLDGGGVLVETRMAIATHAPHVPGAVSGATFVAPDVSARAAATTALV